MTVITIDATYPGGDPVAYRKVYVRVADGGAGATASDHLVVDTKTVTLDANGQGQIDLTPSEDLVPAGTYYSFTVDGAQPSMFRAIEVPATGGPYSWADPAIQVLPVTPPDVIPAPAAGSAGQALFTNGTSFYFADIAAVAPGDWTGLTPPAGWGNLNDFDSSYAPLAVRLAGDAGSVQVRGALYSSGPDFASALGAASSVSLGALVPAPLRPATYNGHLLGALAMVAGALVTTVVLDCSVSPAGEFVLAPGTQLGDGVTDLATFASTADLVIAFLAGRYAL